MNFKDFLNERSAVKDLADNKSEKLTDKKDLEVFSELVRYRTQYAQKNGQEFDSKSLEKTKDELTKLYNFAKSKADPTTGKQDSAAKAVMKKIQKIQDSAKEETNKDDKKDPENDKDKKEKTDKNDKKEIDKEDPTEEKIKQVEKKDARERKENREKDIDGIDSKEKEKLKKTILDNAGVKLAGHALDGAITALAAMFGIDNEVGVMVRDLASNIDKLNDAIKAAKEGREKAKKERDKALKDEIDNYNNAKTSVENNLERAKGDDKKKLKATKDDLEDIHQDNIKAINNNADKKIKQYDAIIAMDSENDKDDKKSKDNE